jgi:hypothetical protein
MGKEHSLRSERDKLEVLLATSEQDKLLLDVRIKEIAGFEGQMDGVLIDQIRGKLLTAANKKVFKLLI